MIFEITKFNRDDTTELFLEEDDSGCVNLIAIDITGERWALLSVQTDGTLYLFNGLEPQAGFKIDKRGRLLISKEVV